MSPLCVLVLLCLMTLTQSAPLTCEQMLRPLDQVDLHHLEGRRALVAGSISNLTYLKKFKQRDSVTINISSNTSDADISYTRSIRMDDKCLYQSYNISLQGSSLTFDGTDKHNVSAILVHTSCPDCMLMRMIVASGKRQHLYLFSRRREVEQKEMEEYKAQVECLNMPAPAVKDPTKELCPEETAQTEETTERQKD